DKSLIIRNFRENPDNNLQAIAVFLNKTVDMKRTLIFIMGLAAGLMAFGQELAQVVAETSSPEWQLVWSDEFSKEGLPDPAKWSYDTGNGCPDLCGWGNNELQFYTDRKENARVQNGFLILEAHREAMENSKFTSARLVTRFK